MENSNVNNYGYGSQPTIKEESKIPYDIIPLPSEGKLYPNGKSELKVEYVTAEDENILTSPNLIKSGKVLDILMERKIKDRDINPKDLLIGDRNAVMIYLRQTAYGDEYPVSVTDPSTGEVFEAIVDLTQLKSKSLGAKPNENMEFDFLLPKSKKNITFRLLTGKDEEYISQKAESAKNLQNGVIPYVTTRLLTQIMSIEGDKDKLAIAEFVRIMSPMDSMALRNYIDTIEPGISLKYQFQTPNGGVFEGNVPIDATFFWPNLRK